MARLRSIGFELNSVTVGHEFENIGGGGLFDIVTTPVKSGVYAGRQNGLSSGTDSGPQIQFAAAAGNGPYFFSIGFYLTTAPTADNTIIRLTNTAFGTNEVEVMLTSTGALKLFYRLAGTQTQIGSTSSALSTGAWHNIQIKFDKSGGNGANIVELKIDGSVVATASNLTVDAGILGLTVGGNLRGQAQTQALWYFDDIIINDSTGSGETGYPHVSEKLIALKPSAAGETNTFATQTGGTAGAGNNFTRVNEITPDDATTFNGSATLNEEDLFDLDDSGIGAQDPVKVVQVNGRFRNSTADATAAIRFEIEKANGGTKSQSASIIPNSTTFRTNSLAAPGTPPITLYLDPDSAAWTKTTLDSMRAGYKLQVGPGTGGRRIDVTKLWVYVGYVPNTTTNSTITGKGRIRKSVSATITGLARLRKTVTQTITGKANILGANVLRTITGKARIRKSVSQTITGKSKINQLPQTRTNLIPNPSFEVNITDNWSTFGTGTATHSRDTTFSKYGGASYKLNANGINTDGGLNYNLTLPAGIYRLAGWIKTVGITGDAKLVMRNTNDFNADINLTVTVATQDWTRVTGTFTVGVSTNFDVLFGLGPYGAPSQGIAYFDGIILEKIPHTTTDETYFDGAIGGTWTGTAHNSTSTWVRGTLTGLARILKTVTQTITGKGDIRKSVTQTITGKARIKTTVSQTITGKARIKKTVSQTITGVARLRKTVTQTITGKSRIQKSVAQTITGKSRVQKVVSQTITGVARLRKTVTQTITGKGRIRKSVSATITGLSRIKKTVSQTITGKARITATVSQTITGKGRVRKTVTQTIAGVARIKRTVTQTITGNARIQKVISATITGKSRIQKVISQTITGKSRVTASTQRTITGKTAVKGVSNQTISGRSMIIPKERGSADTVIRMRPEAEIILGKRDGNTVLRMRE